MDVQEERLERLRARHDSLTASGDEQGLRDLDEDIAEAEGGSLVGSGQPRSDMLEGEQAHAYIAAMMRQGPRGVNAARMAHDARTGSRRALDRLRLAAGRFTVTVARVASHARVSAPRRRARTRPRRGPARAGPSLPRPAGAA